MDIGLYIERYYGKLSSKAVRLGKCGRSTVPPFN